MILRCFKKTLEQPTRYSHLASNEYPQKEKGEKKSLQKQKCHLQRLLSDQVVTTLMEVAEKVELILKVSFPLIVVLGMFLLISVVIKWIDEMIILLLEQDPQDSLVVLSGCGTSGRLAFLITVNVFTQMFSSMCVGALCVIR